MQETAPDSPFFSVIVVTWNRAELLRRCLESLQRQSHRSFQMIVVDNASVDGTDRVLAEFAGFAEVVRNPENLGFAGGVNAGLTQARGAWVALLNNDAEADVDWLTELAQAIRKHPDAGMFASKILSLDAPEVLDNTGLLMYADGVCRGRGRGEVDRGQFDGADEILLPSGCAAVYRRSAVLQHGGMDDRFFCYCDDSDLGLALRIAGHRCVYVPKAVVRHAYSGSAGAYSDFKAYMVERNRIWLVVKNFPLGMLVLSFGFTVARYVLQLAGGFLGKGAYAQFAKEAQRGSALRIVSRAYWHALRELPTMWKRRKRVWASAVLSRRQFRRLTQRFRLTLRQIAWTD